MKNSLRVSLLATAISALFAVPSFAAVVQTPGTNIVDQNPSNGYLGTLTPNSLDDSASFSFKTAGLFSDTFNFDLATNSRLSLSYTAAYSAPNQIVNPLIVTLFNGYNASGTQIDLSSGTLFPDRVGGAFSNNLNSGSYSFNINGNSGDFPSVSGTLTVSVSPVPLPASAPMFGAALLALAGFGYGMNRFVAPKAKVAAQV